MSKKLSKIILGTFGVGMIIVGISLSSLNKNEVEIEDLYGKRSELGDISFVIQSRQGFYETDQIIINKDNQSKSKMVKEGSYLTNLDNYNIKNRDLLEYSSSKSDLFEFENEIGNVYVSNIYTEDEEYILNARVNLKNTKTGKIDSYDISLDDKIDETHNYVYATVPIKKDEDTIYLVTMYTGINDIYDNMAGKESFTDYYLGTTLNFYKLNLSNQTSEHILTKEYKERNLNVSTEMCFSNEDKTYFIVDKKEENDDYFKATLLEFDTATKDIKFIDLNESEYSLDQYFVEDGKAILLSNMYESNSPQVKLVDLKTGEVEYSYNLDISYSIEGLEDLRIRRYDGKIYLVMDRNIGQYSLEDETKNIYNLYVFDENDGKTLYMGKTNVRADYGANVGIIKEDEI